MAASLAILSAEGGSVIWIGCHHAQGLRVMPIPRLILADNSTRDVPAVTGVWHPPSWRAIIAAEKLAWRE